MKKLLTLIREYFYTEVEYGNKFIFFCFFWCTKAIAFLRRVRFPVWKIFYTVAELLCHFDPNGFIITNKSGTFYIPPEPDDTSTICSDYFESHLRNWITRSKLHRVFVDIGANRGLYSIVASRLYQQVHAFEPNPEMVSVLRKNIKLNEFGSKIAVYATALADKEGDVEFTVDPLHAGGGRITENVQDDNNTFLVKIRPFDSYKNIDATEIDFIKIDTEGFEIDVLNGMKQALSLMPKGSCIMIESTEITVVKSILQEFHFVLSESSANDHLFRKVYENTH